MMQIQQAAFDWGSLDQETRAFVLGKTEAIRARMKRTAEDIVAIGQDLLAVQEKLTHGQFLGWLHTEFEMSQRMAYNFMGAAKKFGDKLAKIASFAPSVIYELSAPSMPIEVVEQVFSGKLPASLPAIREAKAALVSPAPVKAPEPEPEPEEEAPPQPAPVTSFWEARPLALPSNEFLDEVYQRSQGPLEQSPYEAYSHAFQKLFRAYIDLTEEVIAAGIMACTEEEAERHARFADDCQQRLAYLRGQVKHRQSTALSLIRRKDSN